MNRPGFFNTRRFLLSALTQGAYFEDQMHGQGTMTNPDGSISFTGRWEMGEEVM